MCYLLKVKIENGAKSAVLSVMVTQYEREPLKECVGEVEPRNILLQIL
jgi:hypothetical protein